MKLGLVAINFASQIEYAGNLAIGIPRGVPQIEPSRPLNLKGGTAKEQASQPEVRVLSEAGAGYTQRVESRGLQGETGSLPGSWHYTRIKNNVKYASRTMEADR